MRALILILAAAAIAAVVSCQPDDGAVAPVPISEDGFHKAEVDTCEGCNDAFQIVAGSSGTFTWTSYTPLDGRCSSDHEGNCRAYSGCFFRGDLVVTNTTDRVQQFGIDTAAGSSSSSVPNSVVLRPGEQETITVSERVWCGGRTSFYLAPMFTPTPQWSAAMILTCSKCPE